MWRISALFLETIPLASDSERESFESELLIEPAFQETNDSPENPATYQSDSSSKEEVQAIPLRTSTRNKRLRRIVTYVIMRPGGGVTVSGNCATEIKVCRLLTERE